MFARVAFWYGLGYREVCGMPETALRGYLEQLPAVQAELSLLLASAASVPYMADEDRRRALKTWERAAGYVAPVQKLSRVELAARLAASGIGLRIVKPEPNQAPG